MVRTLFSVIFFVLSGCFLCVSVHARADILDGLISYWPLEDGDGGVANDIASGLDGELFGDPQWVSGKVGGGLDCDGDGDYVSCGFSRDLMPEEEITIQVWANITEFGNYSAIIGNVQDTGFFEGGFWLGTSIGGYFGLGITTNGTIEPYQWTPPIYNTGQWYHLVATYISGEMRLWVDGSLAGGIANKVRTGEIDYSHSPVHGFVMARYWDDDELFEQALIIDEVAVWNRKISDEEIAWLYNEGMGNPIVNPQPKSGATLVPVDAILSWTSRDTADVAGYDVYFGTDANELSQVLDGQNVTTFSPEMQYGQTYYWRVDVIENVDPGPGTVAHKGLTYSFTTIPLAPEVTVEPENVTGDIGSAVQFSMEGVNAAAHQWYRQGDPVDILLGNDEKYDGADSATLIINDVRVSDEGYYYCIISNGELTAQTTAARLWTRRMIVHLPLDGNVDDQSLSAVESTVVGDPNWVVGISGLSVELNGEYVSIGTSEDIHFDDEDFSVALWVKTSVVPTISALISNKNINDLQSIGWGIVAESSSMRWNIADASMAYDILLPVVYDGQWHHICVTNDRDGLATVYIDGEPQGTADISGAQESVDAGLVVNLGADGVGNNHFAGQFDDVRIYRYALSHYEVAKLYIDFVEEAKICVDRPKGDYNGDCRVDFDDFGLFAESLLRVGVNDLALFAESWLECNLVPTCIP